MDPNFNPDANPFEAIFGGGGQPPMGGGAPMGQGGGAPGGGMPPELLAKLGAGGMPGGAPGGQPNPQAGMAAMQGMMPPMPEIEEPSTYPGSNPGGSKHLISALQSLQKFIAESTDQSMIQAARILTGVLGKLVDRDQQMQATKETEGQGAPPEAGMPPMGGAPEGAMPPMGPEAGGGGQPPMPPMPGM